MILYKKNDLVFSDYKWTAFPKDSPKISGELDDTHFDKQEGNEVLFLINKISELWGFERKTSGERLEKLIKLHLPENLKVQKEIRKWINDNWDNY